MIAPMKKVWLVVLDRERRTALAALRSLGVMHVESLAGKGVECDSLARQLANAEKAVGILSTVKTDARGKRKDRNRGKAAIQGAIEASERIRQLHEESAAFVREYERIRDWGDFDPESFRDLAAAGFEMKIFECPVQRFMTLTGELPVIRLAAPKGRARFVLLRSTLLGSAIQADFPELPSDFEEFDIPVQRASEIESRIKSLKDSIADEGRSLGAFARDLSCAEYEKSCIVSELRFETLRSGMESAGDVAYLGGFVPASRLAELAAEAQKHGWGLASDEPSPDELPPTKVENSPFVRIIDPVFEFLGTVPNYREYDISAWFLGFFCIYFAMIFGDGGYGLILLGAAVYSIFRAKANGGAIPDAVKLLLLLALTTLVWGTATATWFAIPVDRLPGFLFAVAIEPIRNGNPAADTNIKIFCFILGAIQLSVAHIKNIKRDFPNLKFLAQVGSLAMVIGMFTTVLNLVIDPVRFPIPMWAVCLIAGGFVLVFVFGNWEGNLLQSLAAGLKGIIPTFLGTVSVFADIVSYIRLWAVGLAGLAISQTVNGMATGMFGDPAGQIIAFALGAVMGIILLAVGHALNLVMSVLSVVVHGIRLNMLEFSGHLGMEWSGYKYDPLRKTVDGSDE